MTYAHAEPEKPTFAYLVIYSPGQLAGAYLDEDKAHEMALHTQSVVVKAPVVGDYRPSPYPRWGTIEGHEFDENEGK